MWSMAGRPKARVLPDPVSEMALKEREASVSHRKKSEKGSVHDILPTEGHRERLSLDGGGLNGRRSQLRFREGARARRRGERARRTSVYPFSSMNCLDC